MSLFQVEKTLLWAVCLEVLPKIFEQNGSVLSIEHIMPGLFYACSQMSGTLFLQNYVSVENCNGNIKFLHPKGL